MIQPTGNKLGAYLFPIISFSNTRYAQTQCLIGSSLNRKDILRERNRKYLSVSKKTNVSNYNYVASAISTFAILHYKYMYTVLGVKLL